MRFGQPIGFLFGLEYKTVWKTIVLTHGQRSIIIYKTYNNNMIYVKGYTMFSEKELERSAIRDRSGESVPVYHTPVTPKENYLLTLRRKPVWQASVFDFEYMLPSCVPDNVARGSASDAVLPPEARGGYDMFGVKWEYVPSVGGSTVRPGNPLFTNANEWTHKLCFPTRETIASWDWMSYVKHARSLDERFIWEPVIFTGWFERLVSFMDFSDAALALVDPDQREAVTALFDRLSDVYILLIDQYISLFPRKISAFNIHDDWGHQRGQLFSLDTAMEIIVPAMKKVTDHLHAQGLAAEIHSCGKVDGLMPAYIAAGFDLLQCQPILDYDVVVPQYGDRIIFHVALDGVPAEDSPDDAYRACARRFIDRALWLGQPVIMKTYYTPRLAPAFWEEFYQYARIRFCEMPFK